MTLIPRRAHHFQSILESIEAGRWEEIDGEQLKGALAVISDAFRANIDSDVEEAKGKLQALTRALKGPAKRRRRRSLRRIREAEIRKDLLGELYEVFAAGKAARKAKLPPREAMRAEIRRRWSSPFGSLPSPELVDYLMKNLSSGTWRDIKTRLSLSAREQRLHPSKRVIHRT